MTSNSVGCCCINLTVATPCSGSFAETYAHQNPSHEFSINHQSPMPCIECQVWFKCHVPHGALVYCSPFCEEPCLPFVFSINCYKQRTPPTSQTYCKCGASNHIYIDQSVLDGKGGGEVQYHRQHLLSRDLFLGTQFRLGQPGAEVIFLLWLLRSHGKSNPWLLLGHLDDIERAIYYATAVPT